MWNDLNMAQKAELMKIYVQNGIYDLDTVRKDYDARHQSGDEASLPNYSENVFQQGGKLSFKQWKRQMQSKYPDLEMDNNKAGYDYDTYFKENYDDAIKMLNDWGSGAHFTDRYKLPNHPTFSNESMYSTGVNSGGNWRYDLPWKTDEGYMPEEKFEPTVINQQYHPELYGSHKLAYGTPHNPLEDEYITVISRYSGNSPRLERVNNKQSYESYLPDYRKLGISDADSAYYYKNNTVPWIRNGSVRTSPHRGIDLSAAGIGGANVYTTGPATILAVNSNPTGGGGRTVTYRTPDGLIFRNMHLQNIGTYTDATTGQTRPLQPGDVVDEGYVIGNVGGSGLGKDDAYGKHLHFETWLGPQGDNVDVNTIMKNFGRYKSIDPSLYNWDEYHGQGLPEASQDTYRTNRASVTAPYLKQQVPAELINYMYSTLHPEEVVQSEVDNAHANGGNLGYITPYGQWQYPHQVTTIPSNNITMKGVDYPVVGVSDTGDTKLMQPNENYEFNGSYVTEYPLLVGTK